LKPKLKVRPRFIAVLIAWTAASALSSTGVGQSRLHGVRQGLLHGAGSTVSANYVEASRAAYQALRGVSLQYDSVGSGEGIRRVATGSVDFALTDIPLTEYELAQLKLAQIPLFYCGVVVVVNLPGVRDGELRLSDRAVSAIFAGEITRWRDPEVLRTNDGLNVPDLPILVVHRADTSGTSFIFTSYLSSASETWAQRFGLGSRLAWPTGRAVEGSAGVGDAVRGQPGAIGYLEYGNAAKEGLATVQLPSGKDDFVRAGVESFKLALTARSAERASHYQLLTRSPVAGAWPILATEYGLIEVKERASSKDDAIARLLQLLATNPTLADFQFVPYGGRAAGDNSE
jgi:phosphate transport system substrate-binding protein